MRLDRLIPLGVPDRRLSPGPGRSPADSASLVSAVEEEAADEHITKGVSEMTTNGTNGSHAPANGLCNGS